MLMYKDRQSKILCYSSSNTMEEKKTNAQTKPRAFPQKPLRVNGIDDLMEAHGGLASFIFKYFI